MDLKWIIGIQMKEPTQYFINNFEYSYFVDTVANEMKYNYYKVGKIKLIQL